MTPTEQFTDVVYANRVFGALQIRQRTRQLVAELGFPESILGPAALPPVPAQATVTVWADPDGERELAELRRQWLAGERLRLLMAPPDTHSHLQVVVGAA